MVRWDDEPAEKGESVPLQCERCGRDAECPAGVLRGGMIIAVSGMAMFYDPPGFRPPKEYMPDTIQCRHCRAIFGDRAPLTEAEEKELSHVR